MDDTLSLLALADRMLWVTALVAAPVLLASLAVGLVVGLVRTLREPRVAEAVVAPARDERVAVDEEPGARRSFAAIHDGAHLHTRPSRAATTSVRAWPSRIGA